ADAPQTDATESTEEADAAKSAEDAPGESTEDAHNADAPQTDATESTEGVANTENIIPEADAKLEDTVNSEEATKTELDGVPTIGAQNHFLDISEGTAALTYAAQIDHEYAQANIRLLVSKPQQVAFTKIGNTIQMHLKLNISALPEGQYPRVSDFTFVRVELEVAGVETVQRIAGCCISSGYGEPMGDLLLVVFGKSHKFFTENNLVSDSTETKWYQCKMSMTDSDESVKRQHATMQALMDTPAARKFWPIFLNRDSRALKETKPFSKRQYKKARQEVLARTKLNQEQEAAFNQIFSNKNYMAICQGFPGSGKTWLSCAMTACLLRMGVKVIMCATTQEATDRQLESWLDFVKRSGIKELRDVEIVRPYRSIQERTKSDYPDVENDLPGGPATAESIIAQTYEDLKGNIVSRGFNHREYSLQEKTNARATRALQSGETFMRDWNDADDDDTSVQPMYSGEGVRESSNADPKAKPRVLVDMFERQRFYTAKIKRGKNEEWTDEDKKHAAKADAFCKAWEVRRSQLMICTANHLGSEVVRKNFAIDGSQVAIFHDEASQQSEVDTWMFLRMKCAAQVVLLYLIGDQLQLPPTAFSATASPRCNEFGPQSQVSLMKRAIDEGFPYVKLVQVHRSHPDLIAHPNKRTYKGEMVPADNTRNLVLEARFQDAVRGFFNLNAEDYIRRFAVNISDSVCTINQKTRSRSNVGYATVVIALIRHLLNEGVLDLHEIAIVTPYSAQKSLYWYLLSDLAQQTNTPLSKLPKVLTSTTTQGRQWAVVFYDPVITAATTLGELGLQQGEELMNVVNTRAERQFIIFCSNTVTQGDLKQRKTKQPTGRGAKQPVPVPYLLEMINECAGSGAFYEVVSKNHETLASARAQANIDKSEDEMPSGDAAGGAVDWGTAPSNTQDPSAIAADQGISVGDWAAAADQGTSIGNWDAGNAAGGKTDDQGEAPVVTEGKDAEW
ncbi:MAG: hypothetical protein Q9192_003132, partial [Flavoplaca navasiana]